MDMWSSDISDISAHKASSKSACSSSASSSSSTCDEKDDQVLLTGVPLWSDLWTNSATTPTDAVQEEESQVPEPEEDKPEEDIKESVKIFLVSTMGDYVDAHPLHASHVLHLCTLLTQCLLCVVRVLCVCVVCLQSSTHTSRRSRHAQMESNRSRASEVSLQEDLALSWSDPHVLVAPYTFGQVAPHVSEVAAKAQPFTVQVHPQVTFVSDLHAHMCDAEVIGLLAGKWNAQENCLYIQSSFPCFSTVRVEDDGSTDVEMDPGAEIATREAIHRLGLQVVGWYHSHTCFRPDPSTTDIINQHSYQQLFRDANTNVEPFVGLIVSTFDPRRANAESLHQWFHAVPFTNPLKSKKTTNMYLPMRIEVCQLGVIAESCPVETRCSEEAMRTMETNLLGMKTTPDPPDKDKDDEGEDAVNRKQDEEEEEQVEEDVDAPPKKKRKTKGTGKERAQSAEISTSPMKKMNEKQGEVKVSAQPKAKGKRGRPRNPPPDAADDFATDILTVTTATAAATAVAISQPATLSGRGRAQKKKRFYGDDDDSLSLAYFSGSGGDLYAFPPPPPTTTEETSTQEFASACGSSLAVTSITATATATTSAAAATVGPGRRSARASSTSSRFEDYYQHVDSEPKASLRETKKKRKVNPPKKSGKVESKTVPNTNVRYSIKSSGSNRQNKRISSVAKKTESSGSSSSSTVTVKRKQKKQEGVMTKQPLLLTATTVNPGPDPAPAPLPPPPRYISLITALQKESPLAILARALVCSAAPILQSSLLAIVTLGFYYSQHARRTTFAKIWRKKTKIDKIRMSISVWLKFFGMRAVEEEQLLDEVIEFLNLCWHDGNGNRK